MTWESQNASNEFVERSSRAVSAVKKALSKASREFWNCNSDPQEGVTFEKFGPFIYKSFEPEAGLSTRVDGHYSWTRCNGDCSEYTEASNMCEMGVVKPYCVDFIHICPGTVRNCESFDSHITMCNTENATSKRRYQYVEGGNGKLLGEKTGLCNAGITSFSEHLRDFWYCQVCLCTCENDIDLNMDIYINLKEVVSDVYRNKVIIGVRLIKIDNIFHLQIQQAAILQSGIVDLKTKSWAKVNRYNITDSNVKADVDYLRLSWDKRSVELNDIDFDDDMVITGVKFTYSGGLLKLEARGHEFTRRAFHLRVTDPYRTCLGVFLAHWNKLTIGGFIIMYKKAPKQVCELQLYYVDLSSDHHLNNPIHSYPGQHLTLTTSSLKNDVGQTIVPFVDIEPVGTRQPTPLSRIGLFHKSYKKALLDI
ncbi:uncharacterized protein LOC106656852 [Trichogramma pretiosum]|uniref:uncharacterized protein LOC106656852 n=1 Tax=Trichogramma pretiosum TaxID=7493 RepID=UPI0006C94C5B|nr:uncharacterized protein LOC106656852 [Trichogramma pretiosum]